MNKEAILDRLFMRDEAVKREACQHLATMLKNMVTEGQFREAAELLRCSLAPTLDYTTAQALCRIQKHLKAEVPGTQKVRLAILGSFTTDLMGPIIDLYLFGAEITAEIYSADFGVFRQEILNPDSPLYEFKPKVIYLATSWKDLGRRPTLEDDRSAVLRLAKAEFSDWMALWKTAHERLGCQIIQNNFDSPPWRSLGNHEMRHPSSLGRFIAQMNQVFQEQAPPYVTLHDVDYLAASAGRWAWGDERFFHQAKLPCAPEFLVDYGHSVASLLIAIQGLSKKCLVLDLDNTLWGGIIGDDGLGGIRLGQGDPEGEAFLAFQRYVKSLQDRGIILAVCSKNEESFAKEVFEKHSEMVLRLKDISCFVANWNDKATNLRAIAQRLGIGLNSLVLVDDNPAERALVRQLAPDVAVPELPTDVTGYIHAIERYRYFQTVSIGAEDLKRTEYYQANASRQQAEVATGNIEDFLSSLQMVARTEPITSATRERSTQLINKSNQFNLTTRRRSSAEVLAIVEDPQWITRTIALADRFGDNGLISVLLAKISGDVLDIDTWLMSCRVLKRGVEAFLLNHLCDLAAARGVTKILGEYIPTAKNVIVKDHYTGLGFREIRRESDGHCWYELDLQGRQPLKVFITEGTTHA